jgi:hypothetical protein
MKFYIEATNKQIDQMLLHNPAKQFGEITIKKQPGLRLLFSRRQ